MLSRMIDRLPHLETLVLDNVSNSFLHVRDAAEDWFSSTCPRLTSLTLSSVSMQMDELQSLFSQTPSLRHLKVVIRSHDMTDGSRWEEIIKSQLPELNKLEFYTNFSHCLSENESAESLLNEMIVPFRSPSWTEEKRWRVICNVFPTDEKLEIYTSPICTSQYTQVFDPKTMSISNFERETQYSTVLETVNELSVDLCRILADDRVSTVHHSSTFLSSDRICLNFSHCSMTN